jgi:hypothetical protein
LISQKKSIKIMKTLFVLLLLSTSALTQNCPYLLKSLSKIDTNYNHKKGEPVRFRFNYDARWAMLESPTSEKQAEAFISELQKSLNDAYVRFQQEDFSGVEYNTERAHKMYIKLQDACPDVKFTVYKKEIMFYDSINQSTRVRIKKDLIYKSYTITEDSLGVHAIKSSPHISSNTASNKLHHNKTKHVSGHYRNGRYVKPYYRAPRGSYSTGRSRSRRRR